jgi:probable rRNA maturation factor
MNLSMTGLVHAVESVMPSLDREAEKDPSDGSTGADDEVPPQPVDVDLVLETADTDPPLAGWLEEQLRGALDLLGVREAAVCVVVVDDARMSALHQEYRQVAGTTDVLTFDMGSQPEAAGGPRIEGDLVLCRDVARRQARRRGHPARAELLLYAVHGVLHLLGYDDHDAAAARRMHRREDQVLAALGVGAVYRRNRPAPDDDTHNDGSEGLTSK